MPDIAMCEDNECPMRTLCYRHADSGTKPDEYQSYAGFKWMGDESGGTCDAFWPAE